MVTGSPPNASSRPLLLGHRGLRVRGCQRPVATTRTENSLAAFEYALSQGCDGFEFDVRHTRDDKNVLWHDPEWKGIEIAATDYADLSGSGDNVACLDEALRQFGDRAYLDIELKMAGHEESVIAALRDTPPRRGFVVSSFYPDVLTRLHELDSDLPLGFICDRDEAMAIWRELPIRVFLPRHDFVAPALIETAHDRGQKIMTWTVNSARRMQRLAAWGIDGLISDDPALLCQTFHIA